MNKTKVKRKVLIIGGGLTGLTAAYELGKNGWEVEVWEKEKELGGLAGGFKLNGTYLEKTYHHIFRTDKEILGLIDELGLKNRLKWIESKVAIYYGGKMYPFVTPMDLLKFEPLSLWDKIRTGLIGIYLQKDNNWKKYEKVTAWEWMQKWGGKQAYRVIWEPLLRGKFHQYYDKISMAWMWARIHTRGGSKDADGKERLGYLIGGFQQIIDELEKRILKNGGEIRKGVEVKDNEILPPQWRGQNDNVKIISTLPEKGVDYLGAIDVVFTSPQSLSRYYWHNINDKKSPFLAFIQQTNFVEKENYRGEHVYYLGTYIPHDHKFFKMSEEKIYKEFFGYLKKIFPQFDRKKISKKFVFKFRNAQHIVDTNYQLSIINYQLKKNFYKVNFAQIYPEDRGMNYAVREGKKVATGIGISSP